MHSLHPLILGGEPEVNESDFQIAAVSRAEQDVLQLDVSVHYVLAVQIEQAAQYLLNDHLGLLFIHMTFLQQSLYYRTSFYYLSHDAVLHWVFNYLHYLEDSRVLNLLQDEQLVVE